MTVTPEHGPFPYQPCAWAPTARVARGGGGGEPLPRAMTGELAFERLPGVESDGNSRERVWALPDIEEVNDWVLERAREEFAKAMEGRLVGGIRSPRDAPVRRAAPGEPQHIGRDGVMYMPIADHHHHHHDNTTSSSSSSTDFGGFFGGGDGDGGGDGGGD